MSGYFTRLARRSETIRRRVQDRHPLVSDAGVAPVIPSAPVPAPPQVSPAVASTSKPMMREEPPPRIKEIWKTVNVEVPSVVEAGPEREVLPMDNATVRRESKSNDAVPVSAAPTPARIDTQRDPGSASMPIVERPVEAAGDDRAVMIVAPEKVETETVHVHDTVVEATRVPAATSILPPVEEPVSQERESAPLPLHERSAPAPAFEAPMSRPPESLPMPMFSPRRSQKSVENKVEVNIGSIVVEVRTEKPAVQMIPPRPVNKRPTDTQSKRTNLSRYYLKGF